MSNFTKQAIKTTFLKMLEEKPLSQITVKSLVTECGINRNSFYYHFADIPDLIEEIIIELADDTIKKYPKIESLEEICEVALEFAYENKKIVLHVYNSVSRDIFEEHLMKLCDYAVTTYINSLLVDKKANEEKKEIVINIIKFTCFGLIMDWLNKGMKEDLRIPFRKICDMNKGHVERLAIATDELL